MTYILIIIMTLAGSFASFFLKKASTCNEIKQYLKNPYVYLGLFIYGLSAILNILVLRDFDYSTVLPLTSLTYVWTLIISKIFLKENITSKKIIGITLILFGASFVAGYIKL